MVIRLFCIVFHTYFAYNVRNDHEEELTMHKTLAQIKDVEFVSYLRPSELHGHVGSLQMSFRLIDMQEDELIIDIQQDKEKNLYTTNIEYYEVKDDELFSLAKQFDPDELYELLKAVLNSDVTQKELSYYGMDDYVECYAKINTYDFEVLVTNEILNQQETIPSPPPTPMDACHQFSSKSTALNFFYTVIHSYKKHAVETSKQGFGSHKVLWQDPQTKADVLTYILLHHQGEEIASLDAYNKL